MDVWQAAGCCRFLSVYNRSEGRGVPNRLKWIGLFPELSGIGGIQQVSRHAAAVLAQKAQECKRDYRLLGFNDPVGIGRFRVGEREYSYRGFGRNKVRLLFHLLRALPRLELLYLGHVNLAPLGMLISVIGSRVQYWVVIHGIEVWQPLPLLRRIGLRRARRIVAVSEYTAKSAARVQGLHADRFSLVPPALDPCFLRAIAKEDALSLSANSIVLLTVGRLVSNEPGKGIDSVIRILPDLLRVTPNLFYVVIGGGDLMGALAEMVEASPVRNRILLAGPLKGDQLRQFYERAEIFVMPSRQEGFGLVFLEAMAMGKPVIGGNCGGTPEVVQDEVTGFLVDPDNPDMLATRLMQLLRDPTLRRTMGEAGQRRVEECYSFRSFSERLRSTLDLVVNTETKLPVSGTRKHMRDKHD